MTVDLIYNLALLVAISVVSGFVETRWKRNTLLGALIQGVVFGGAAVVGMLRPFVYAPGLIFDGRSVMISLGGLFFGPWTVAVACLMTIPLRIMQGGPGAGMGVSVILASAVIGVVFHLRRTPKSREVSASTLLGFGVAVHLAMLAMTIALPRDIALPVLKRIGWPVMLTYPLATVLIGKILSDQAARASYLESLRAAERRLADIIEFLPDATFVIDQEKRVIAWNRACEVLTGVKKQAMLGQGDYAYAKPFFGERRPILIDLLDKSAAEAEVNHELAQRKGDMIFAESYLPRLGESDGVNLWAVASPLFDQDGHRCGAIEVIRDVTAQKHMELALRESELKYRALFETASDAILLMRDNRVIDCNARTLAMFECGRERIIGEPPYQFSPPTQPDGRPSGEKAKEKINTALAKEPQFFEWEHLRNDGTPFTAEVSLNRLELDGQVLLQAIMRDVTERKRTEEAIRQSEEQFRLIMENLADLVAVLDLEGRRLYSSPSYRGILGDPDRLQGSPSFEQVHPEDRDRVQATFQKMVSTRAGQRFDYRMMDLEGHVRHIESQGSVIRDAQGRVEKVAVVSRDITERKRAEEEREKLEAQLRQAQKMEAVGRLAGGVAHDFNNILQSILGYSQMLMETLPEQDETHEFAADIYKEGGRAAALTRQLLAFARKQTIAPETLNLNEAVAGMLKMLGRLIGEDIHLLWRPGSDPWMVKMDPAQVDQILANLVVNARDAIAGVGKITIETQNVEIHKSDCANRPGFIPGQYVMLAVSDNGCGMDKETQERIFEPFFTTKELGKGTGLGLATVYGIIRQNNGFINLYSEPGLGATFKIYMPRHEPERREASPALESQDLPGGTETVLLVEDEASLLNLSRILLTQLGYTALAADTPGKAMSLFKEYPGAIHVLLTDVILPEMNGRELYRRLKELRPELKCMYMSGYTANVIAHQGILEDGVHFLQKPFSNQALAAKLRQAISQP